MYEQMLNTPSLLSLALFDAGASAASPIAAFGAGVVSFLSPCVLPLVPGYISMISGATVETLQEAVKHRGSSLADEQYVDLFGKPGEFQQFHNVYAREGEACPRCRHVIVRERVSGRSTFYCEACQV